MALGTVATSIFTDIANAIRWQAGVATLNRPSQMAGAVAALDGSDAGAYAAQPYMTLESGVLSSSVFDDIADAIRAQNGSAATYAPDEMAAAILALDFSVAARALLLDDGTLEFNCRAGVSSDVGTVAQAFEVDTGGYASAGARPWDAVKAQVTRVVFDADFADAGMTNLAYFFTGCSALREVVGFDVVDGMTDATQMFSSCSALETVWGSGFDPSTIVSGSSALYGCYRLVGGTDSTACTGSSPASALYCGAGGLLTDPEGDTREWVWANLYSDGELVLAAAEGAETGRSVLCSGRLCAGAAYALHTAMPWSGSRASVLAVVFGVGVSVGLV